MCSHVYQSVYEKAVSSNITFCTLTKTLNNRNKNLTLQRIFTLAFFKKRFRIDFDASVFRFCLKTSDPLKGFG